MRILTLLLLLPLAACGSWAGAQPKVRVLGVYRVDPTPELFSQGMKLKYADLDLSPAQRAAAERTLRDELGSIALLDVAIDDADERFDTGDFGQPGSDQAAYDEAYLTADGERVISRGFSRPPGDSLRVAFFLHFFDPSKTLRTSYGEASVWPATRMPENLAKLLPYEPVD